MNNKNMAAFIYAVPYRARVLIIYRNSMYRESNTISRKRKTFDLEMLLVMLGRKRSQRWKIGQYLIAIKTWDAS